MIYAPKFPLRKRTKGSFENIETTKELVRFHLTNLLLTNPGEKISDPDYGVGIRNFLFENSSDSILSDIEDAIEEGIEQYVYYINLNDVRVTSSPEENKLNITISYALPNDTENQILEIALNIGQTGTSGPSY